MSKPAKIAKILGQAGKFSTTSDLIKLTRDGLRSSGLPGFLTTVD